MHRRLGTFTSLITVLKSRYTILYINKINNIAPWKRCFDLERKFSVTHQPCLPYGTSNGEGDANQKAIIYMH